MGFLPLHPNRNLVLSIYPKGVCCNRARPAFINNACSILDIRVPCRCRSDPSFPKPKLKRNKPRTVVPVVLDDKIAGDLLGAAIQYTDEAFLQYLLDSGIQPNIRDSKGYFVLLHAPQHKVELVGERNWEFMARHGSNEQQAICSIDSSKIEHIEANAPEWFARTVSEFRPTCSPM